MQLLDLDPQWIDRPWADRFKIGISFRCPHCTERIPIFFANPLDGGSPKHQAPRWTVTSGDTFSNLTLSPSINWLGHFHGHLVNGELYLMEGR